MFGLMMDFHLYIPGIHFLHCFRHSLGCSIHFHICRKEYTRSVQWQWSNTHCHRGFQQKTLVDSNNLPCMLFVLKIQLDKRSLQSNRLELSDLQDSICLQGKSLDLKNLIHNICLQCCKWFAEKRLLGSMCLRHMSHMWRWK